MSPKLNPFRRVVAKREHFAVGRYGIFQTAGRKGLKKLLIFLLIWEKKYPDKLLISFWKSLISKILIWQPWTILYHYYTVKWISIMFTSYLFKLDFLEIYLHSFYLNFLDIGIYHRMDK